jgi:hypothetical protein
LTEIAVCNLHPEVEPFAEGQRRQRARPPFRFWRLDGGRGLILHTFFGLPVLMDFAVVPADHTACLDHSDFESAYLGRGYSLCKLRVVTDSDECGILSLTPASVNRAEDRKIFARSGVRLMPQLALIADIRNSMMTYAPTPRDSIRRNIFRQSVRWHTRAIDDYWLEKEAQIEQLITRAAGDYYGNPPSVPARFQSNLRYWLFDLIGLQQHLVRYIYSLQTLFAALAGDIDARILLRRKLSAISVKYFGVLKR